MNFALRGTCLRTSRQREGEISYMFQEKNKEYEISLYINKHLKKHASVVRIYKKSLQHDKAESYISSLSPEVAEKVRSEEVLILNNIEKDLMKYLQKEKLYSEEVKHIEDILNTYRKAS